MQSGLMEKKIVNRRHMKGKQNKTEEDITKFISGILPPTSATAIGLLFSRDQK